MPVVGDNADEPDEGFTVELSLHSGVALIDASGTATITDDDGPDQKAAALTSLRVGPSAFRPAESKSSILRTKPRTRGTTISFTLDEQATVSFRIVRVLKKAGRLVRRHLPRAHARQRQAQEVRPDALDVGRLHAGGHEAGIEQLRVQRLGRRQAARARVLPARRERA